MNEGNISTESAAGDYLTSNMRFVTELWQNTFHKKKKMEKLTRCNETIFNCY